MSANFISGKEFWKLIHSETPFSIQFVTFDENRNRGGKRIRLKKAIRCNLAHNGFENRQIGIRPANGNHHDYAVHLSLIEYINDKRVI